MEFYIKDNNVNDITYQFELTRQSSVAGSIRTYNLRRLKIN